MKEVSVKLDEDLLELLNWYALKHNIPRAVAIRKAVERLLAEEAKR